MLTSAKMRVLVHTMDGVDKHLPVEVSFRRKGNDVKLLIDYSSQGIPFAFTMNSYVGDTWTEEEVEEKVLNDLSIVMFKRLRPQREEIKKRKNKLILIC